MKICRSNDWRPVSGYLHLYEVSSAGFVRSLRTGRLLTPQSIRGYAIVALSDHGRVTRFAVHRLVASAFLPTDPLRPHVNHKDGNKQHNDVDNLEWVSISENNRHAYRTGLRSSKGERHSGAKLSEVDVLSIRARVASGECGAAVARDFGIHRTTVSQINRRILWSHI